MSVSTEQKSLSADASADASWLYFLAHVTSDECQMWFETQPSTHTTIPSCESRQHVPGLSVIQQGAFVQLQRPWTRDEKQSMKVTLPALGSFVEAIQHWMVAQSCLLLSSMQSLEASKVPAFVCRNWQPIPVDPDKPFARWICISDEGALAQAMQSYSQSVRSCTQPSLAVINALPCTVKALRFGDRFQHHPVKQREVPRLYQVIETDDKEILAWQLSSHGRRLSQHWFFRYKKDMTMWTLDENKRLRGTLHKLEFLQLPAASGK